ncbi:MAG: small subunit ribosomal protein [Archaeoglobaceae archaeon]|nr:small subunit ribosomal protein [Archaeoglobaceae archaeon]MDK2876437.1 small subunit ribosomal protein [Archaeoglobaceae archaeon]
MKVVVTSGKRKTAVARAVAREGAGRIRVNRIPIEIFHQELPRKIMMEPLKMAQDLVKNVDIDVKVSGGGIMGQAEAVRTAIARALVEFSGDEELRKLFLEYDRTLLVNDVRRKLPKLQGGRGARKRRQTSYR